MVGRCRNTRCQKQITLESFDIYEAINPFDEDAEFRVRHDLLKRFNVILFKECLELKRVPSRFSFYAEFWDNVLDTWEDKHIKHDVVNDCAFAIYPQGNENFPLPLPTVQERLNDFVATLTEEVAVWKTAAEIILTAYAKTLAEFEAIRAEVIQSGSKQVTFREANVN